MKKIYIILIVFVLFLLPVKDILAQNNDVNLYIFYSQTCPHCQKELDYLDRIEDDFDYLLIHKYEVIENKILFEKIGNTLDIKNFGYVPVTFIGNDYFVGYRDDPTSGQQITNLIEKYHTDGDPDVIGQIIRGEEISPTITPFDTETVSQASQREQLIPDDISIPLLGKVDLKGLSLPVLTFFLALADGFNPCAMWVLLFLISILLGMENKKRAYTLGIAFIATSGLVYFLFLSAWLNLFLTIGFISWIRLAVGVFALGAGIYQLVQFCLDKAGGCVAKGGEKRRKIFERLREITKEKNIFIALTGIVLLAVAVNMIELVCSLGLPAIYTQVLSLTPMSPIKYYAYLAFYVLIFMIDDLLVFFIAMITLHQTAIQSKYARYNKLIGGIIIFILGLLLLLKPEALMFG